VICTWGDMDWRTETWFAARFKPRLVN